jgi:hypothetical protein
MIQAAMKDDGEIKRCPPKTTDWRDLAAQASEEQDQDKLSQLVKQLCDRLDHDEQQKKMPLADEDRRHPNTANKEETGECDVLQLVKQRPTGLPRNRRTT